LPLAAMGSLAAQVLLATIDSAEPADGRVAQSLLGVELAVRGTTAAAPLVSSSPS
jgi:DNA-binding LacI/PurR family transcriptional regulator